MSNRESLLVELRRSARLELKRTRDSIKESLTSAVNEVIQCPSMSRSSKRSRLYKIQRNYETMCERTSDSYNRAYGMFDILCLPEELMPEFSISTILSTDVTIHSEPLALPVMRSLPAVTTDHSTTSGFVTDPSLGTVEGVRCVPVSLQPVVPLAQHTYDVLPSIAKRKIPFTSYFRLTVLQTYEYLSRFGCGVVRLQSDMIHLPEENFPEVVAFLRTLRPATINGQLFAGVLLRSGHHVYNYRLPSGLSQHRFMQSIGDILSDAAPSVNLLLNDVTRFNEMVKCLKDAKSRGEDCITTGRIYSGGLPRKLGGDQCILTHQLLWFRKDENPERRYVGSCNLYHHGCFYDPKFGISYLTSSLTLILQKLKDYALKAAPDETLPVSSNQWLMQDE